MLIKTEIDIFQYKKEIRKKILLLFQNQLRMWNSLNVAHCSLKGFLSLMELHFAGKTFNKSSIRLLVLNFTK